MLPTHKLPLGRLPCNYDEWAEQEQEKELQKWEKELQEIQDSLESLLQWQGKEGDAFTSPLLSELPASCSSLLSRMLERNEPPRIFEKELWTPNGV